MLSLSYYYDPSYADYEDEFASYGDAIIFHPDGIEDYSDGDKFQVNHIVAVAIGVAAIECVHGPIGIDDAEARFAHNGVETPTDGIHPHPRADY